ncbi:hypothetical protein, unlikely [Trypanosoma brucei brucei TREU927]|uniref:Uncharacterized protein n=1 Tax=Trypanosoma brucei brucei (strain 927/4 GUTat10.1) TaxID=185431 RepID=Q38EZ5_TRYB2|nr:hypothetical protein, unlikely [Trypanosoma brucei brucei TREU927]EAN76625.1 hypothetical protein, unlikely [Trypanosoma brucei brucei TREU927]
MKIISITATNRLFSFYVLILTIYFIPPTRPSVQFLHHSATTTTITALFFFAPKCFFFIFFFIACFYDL